MSLPTFSELIPMFFSLTLGTGLPAEQVNSAAVSLPAQTSIIRSIAEVAPAPPAPLKVVQAEDGGPSAELLECIRVNAEKNNIDPLLVEIVIKHESAFDPQACSGVGASGLMQLMPETAQELGVTDLNDPQQNVAAGTKYLASQLHHYGDVKLALAAYNAGPGNVDYYGGIPPFEETQNYAYSISTEYDERRNAQ